MIGKRARNVSAADAAKYVAGYTTAHDVSARDWQLKRNGGQWLLGKAMDAFCPLGPAVVTEDELGDPEKLRLSCEVNGVVKQDSNTDQVIKLDVVILTQIAFFSKIGRGISWRSLPFNYQILLFLACVWRGRHRGVGLPTVDPTSRGRDPDRHPTRCRRLP